ncbi:hypothetical protein BH09PSE5_BH09PSE5_00960 [soil metagenome]
MWINRVLYERLPAIYVVAGAASFATFEPGIVATTSSALFVCAGLVALALRRRHRRELLEMDRLEALKLEHSRRAFARRENFPPFVESR